MSTLLSPIQRKHPNLIPDVNLCNQLGGKLVAPDSDQISRIKIFAGTNNKPQYQQVVNSVCESQMTSVT